MRIVVGSKNPVKVGAVEEAFKRYWPESEVVGVEVSSGVNEQPMSEIETVRGARNRAQRSIGEADYGVGIEGGVCEIEGKLFECAWVCVVAKSQIKNPPCREAGSQILKLKNQEYMEGLGGGLYFELPSKIAKQIKAGGELGPLMDEFTGKTNVKQGSGAIGIFTKGELDRKSAYAQIVLQALIKHVSPEWFK